ncbi:MAG TPA: tripartite tricarboxylate transporter TctB family protein [Rectinema sp.]|nr:tripartite tricarboxylate transporter TctB family protein [Rectinema sp.]HPN04025.1 tripartite tricarboxylate transporter TctB family protein [Rectinema sp.]HQL16871.1 tripartite tricarboxylate transporter TctB family protein [Rectinema sp.]
MTTNILTGIISIVLGLVYSITALRLPHMTMGDRLGPKIFPYFVGIVTIITGIAMILQDRNPEKRSKKVDFGFKEHKNVWIKIGLLTIAGIIFGLVIDGLGYMIATALFMFFVSMLINRGRLVQNTVIAVLFSVVTYFVFGVALKLSLPRGIIETMLPF